MSAQRLTRQVLRQQTKLVLDGHEALVLIKTFPTYRPHTQTRQEIPSFVPIHLITEPSVNDRHKGMTR